MLRAGCASAESATRGDPGSLPAAELLLPCTDGTPKGEASVNTDEPSGLPGSPVPNSPSAQVSMAYLQIFFHFRDDNTTRLPERKVLHDARLWSHHLYSKRPAVEILDSRLRRAIPMWSEVAAPEPREPLPQVEFPCRAVLATRLSLVLLVRSLGALTAARSPLSLG